MKCVEEWPAAPEFSTKSLVFKIGDNELVISGGPYTKRPVGMPGVNMAKEIKNLSTISIPTEDFSVPDQDRLKRGLLASVMIMMTGKHVYVGCAGGIGRTGLFLAALAKLVHEVEHPRRLVSRCIERILRVSFDPVASIRVKYDQRAIETKQQEDFIQNLDLSNTAKVVRQYRDLLQLGNL